MFPKDKIFTVTELNSIVKEMLEGAFPEITVEGEISNLKIAASGHIYFDLKDKDALIAAVFFRGYAQYCEAKLANGLAVTLRGGLSCYAKQGKYQIIVKSLRARSAGELFLAFERLKKKLYDEGLFDDARKKPIPEFPSVIGIVTSPTGAAIRDMLSILRRRSPNIRVVVAPVPVQGDGAKEAIAQAINDLNDLKPAPDVLLVGRGGGSIEDLWAFNEEIVARAIADSAIPVISCVGHETDFTIADFAADLRAPTPSAAAELVVKNRADIAGHLGQLKTRLLQSLRLFYERLRNRVETLAASRVMKNPELIWRDRAQRVDELFESALAAAELAASNAEQRLGALAQRLHALNPSEVLRRGYGIVRRLPEGAVIADSADAAAGDRVSVKLYKGELTCKVEESL